jgi:hypothetical protein
MARDLIKCVVPMEIRKRSSLRLSVVARKEAAVWGEVAAVLAVVEE